MSKPFFNLYDRHGNLVDSCFADDYVEAEKVFFDKHDEFENLAIFTIENHDTGKDKKVVYNKENR